MKRIIIICVCKPWGERAALNLNMFDQMLVSLKSLSCIQCYVFTLQLVIRPSKCTLVLSTAMYKQQYYASCSTHKAQYPAEIWFGRNHTMYHCRTDLLLTCRAFGAYLQIYLLRHSIVTSCPKPVFGCPQVIHNCYHYHGLLEEEQSGWSVLLFNSR